MAKEIQLTKGLVTIVDDADYEWLNEWKWGAWGRPHRYVAARKDGYYKKRVSIQMHRLLLNVIDDDMQIDHIDGNTLNNQRLNLRIATHQQNQFNKVKRSNCSSYYIGVSWNKHANKWRSIIYHNDKTIHLGYFDSELDAALAYDEVVRKLHGEFAKLNFE